MTHLEAIKKMENDVIDCLDTLDPGYGMYKFAIIDKTGIPIDILTVILKRLKDLKVVKLIQIFDWDGKTAGRGYGLTSRNI